MPAAAAEGASLFKIATPKDKLLVVLTDDGLAIWA